MSACRESIPASQIYADRERRFAYGTDASFYRLTPKLVIRADDENDVVCITQSANRYRVPITYRAAGTSLSGQAITDSVLVIMGDGFNRVAISADGRTVTAGPAAIGSDVNRRLQPWRRKIGPDPASINACRIGGIVANNASGMCCGTAHNAYRTLAGMRVVLADGSLLDTRDPASVAAFRASHGDLLDRTASLAASTRANKSLADRIGRKYRLKNTVGYSLNALIDFEDPIDILAHLMVGSEGTLGFISEVTLRTVANPPHRAVALVVYDDIQRCCDAVQALESHPVSAIEIMDSRSMRSIAGQPGAPFDASDVDALGADVAALLVECRAQDSSALDMGVSGVTSVLAGYRPVDAVEFSRDARQVEQIWALRQGLFPSIGATRKIGTTVVSEDIAVRLRDLPSAVRDLQGLFLEFGYDEALIFGHARDGNLHFVFSQRFDSDAEIDRYRRFMNAVCTMITDRYDGALKAEHGTGRNMAPFVEQEWGAEAYRLMRKLKESLDANGILNPGVILNSDPLVHVKNFKLMPAAHERIDKCTECGFCEPVCPSRALTLTPRQRIALFREIRRRADDGDEAIARQMMQRFQYLGVDTCVATGLCAQRCPVDIDTGKLVSDLRSRGGVRQSRLANFAARRFALTTFGIRAGLATLDACHGVLGTERMSGLMRGVSRLTRGAAPLWSPSMPRPGRPSRLRSRQAGGNGRRVVYWPSCVARNLAPPRASNAKPLPDCVVGVLHTLGYDVEVVAQNSLCCGQPFASKGFMQAADRKADELERELLKYSAEGELALLTDTSPCARRISKRGRVEVLDPLHFLDRELVEVGKLHAVAEPIALHVTCSAQRLGLTAAARRVAGSCASSVVVPEGIECCGFAGDKGFNRPELNASALRTLAEQVAGCGRGYSTSLTCEIGLSHHSGIEYQSIFHLVERALRSDSSPGAVRDA